MTRQAHGTRRYGVASALITVLVLCVGCGGGGPDPQPFPPAPPPPADRAAWTVMVYMAADNDLAGDALRDLNEMELVGSDENVKIVVQIDLPASGGFPWSTARRYLVEQDLDPGSIGSRLLADLGELDMSRPETLTGFLRWARTAYPSDRTLLVLWGHGEAWDEEEYARVSAGSDRGESRVQAIFNDHSGDPFAFMKNFELASALAAAGGPFDIIAFDACVMQILEVAYEIRDRASIMLASQEVVWQDGFPYDAILGPLAAAPATTPENLARAMVRAFGDYYDALSPPRREQCLSAVRLNRVAPVAAAVEGLAASLRARLSNPGVRDALAGLRDDMEDFTVFASRYADLHSMAGLLASGLGLDTSALAAAVESAVIRSYSGPRHPGARGLSLYYPRTKIHYDMDSSYTNYNPATGRGSPCRFVNDFHWDEFLAELYAP